MQFIINLLYMIGSFFLIVVIADGVLMTWPTRWHLKYNSFPEKYIIKKKNRIELQQNNECSAFATAYLLRHFEIETNGIDVYKKIPSKMRSGDVYPKGIRKYLKNLGFKTVFHKGTINSLKQEISKGVPVIVFIKVAIDKKYRHYVPVIGYDTEYFYIAESLNYLINDESEKKLYNRKVNIKEFKKLWDIKNITIPIYSYTYITAKKI